MVNHIISFTPSYQNYTWGKSSSESLVTKYLKNVDKKLPYAELWVGAHPKAPGKVNGELSLNEHIKQHLNECLGSCLSDFGNELPFLLKILSINKPLSIQAHPDKILATKLHEQRPDLYPDSNHKPEMGVALSTLDLLSGFKDPEEIFENASMYPAIKIASDYVDPRKNLKLFFKNILDYPKQGLASLFNSIVRKMGTIPYEELKIEEKYFLKTYKEDFPEGDHGLFCFFLLKFLRLKTGDAIEIKANTPHCYLHGDLLECMANSDNVVRAGLTNKHCDAPVLVDMLDYTAHEHSLLTKIIEKDNLKITKFLTSAKEFKLSNIVGSDMNYEIKTQNKPLIIFNLSGDLEFYTDKLKVSSCPITKALFVPASTSKINVKLHDVNLYIASPSDI